MTAVTLGATGAAPGELDLAAVFAGQPGAAVVYAADAPHFTVLAASDALLELAQRPREAVIGRRLAEAFPSASPDAPAASGLASLSASLAAAVRTGVPQRLPRQRYDIQRPDGTWEERYWDAVNVPLHGPDGRVRYVFHHTEDVTAQVRGEAALLASEARHAFVLRLSDRLLPLADPEQIQYEAALALGEYLGASRVGYAEIEPDGQHSVVTRNYTAGVRGIEGRYRIADYSPALLEALHAGRTVARGDIAVDPTLSAAERAAHAALELAATVDLPLIRGGRLVAVLFMHRRAPHAWTADELALLADVAGRTWDAVERARGEAAQRDSEARFRTVQDASPLGFAIHRPVREGGRPDGRVVDFTLPYVNEAGARIVGHPRERLLAGTVLGIWPGTGPEGVFADYVRVLETGEPGYREILYERDGLAAGLTLTVVRIGEGAHAEIGVTFTDVTARMRAERERDRLLAELGAERERLRSVILHMPSPLALHVGPEHRFELVNDEFRRISGGGRDDTGLTVREAFPELAGQGVIEALDRVWATGEPWVASELPIRYDRDGTGLQDTWYNVRYEPVRDAGGRVVGILNFAVDVTAQVRARREVEGLLAESERARSDADAARREAEAANRAKGEFLAVMSHELRTPLNAIGGYAELIELGIRGPVTDQQRDDLARIQRSQRALLGLINEVLNYARLETGAVTYDIADVPVAEVVGAAEVLVAPQLRAKGLGYGWAGAPPELAVRADRDKLQQILLNLLSNAIKFTSARAALPGRVEVSCDAADDVVRIRVRDTGVGIAADKLDAIFEPFVQVDATLTRTEQGAGLGLAISRDLARGMGGDLTAESTPGTGSTFTLGLPRA